MGNQESNRKLTIINEYADGSVKITDEAGKKVENSIRKAKEESGASGRPQQPQQQQQQQSPGLTESNLLPYHADDVPLESLTLRKRHSEEIKHLERVWNARLKEYEDQNKYLWYTTTAKLSDDLTKIENKYTHRRRYDALCPEIEAKLESCYQQNRSASLRCSQQVRDFESCVRDARLKALQSA